MNQSGFCSIKAILSGILLIAGCLFTPQLFANEKEKTMTQDEMKQFHEALAPALFNASWDLLEKADRTIDDENKLINIVHASLFHWRQVGKRFHIMRGEWMIAHVYTILGQKEPALYHAQNCLRIARELGSGLCL